MISLLVLLLVMNVAGVHAYIPYTRAYKVARMLPEEYALYDAKEAVRRETRGYEQRVQEAHDPRIRQGDW